MKKANSEMPFAYNKAEIIADELKKEIRRQKLTGKLPSELVLAKKYNVNIKTTNKALSKLIESGFTYRQRGIGTFVHDDASKFEEGIAQNTIALFMPSHGHLYEDFYNYMMMAYKKNKIFPILLNSTDHLTTKESRDLIDQAVRFNCKMFLVAHMLSESEFDFKYLQSKQKLFQRIFIVNCHTSTPVNAVKISTDPFKGAYQAVEHLLAGGCRRILFVNHQDMYCSERFQIRKDEYYQGYIAALRDHGMESDELTFAEGADSEENVRKLKKILSVKNRPDGVFCVQDNRATRCVKAAMQLGLRIPKDLAIVGYFNTPWSRFSSPALSSVSIGEEKMADILCEKIASDKFTPEEILVKPELVIRESSVISS